MLETLNRKSLVFILPLLSILALSAFAPAFTARAATGTNATDWNGPMGTYPFNLGYSGQTQITPSNAANLQLNWVFPVPAAPSRISGGLGGFLSPQGTIVTPLIVGGIVYTITNFQLLLALDASNGKIIWTKDLSTINAPNGVGNVTAAGHYHSLYYSATLKGAALPLVWVACGSDCMEAFKASTGDLYTAFSPQLGSPPASDLNFGTNCLKGNAGYSFAHDWMVIDENAGVLITGNGASEGSDSCRGTYIGFDLSTNPPTQLWRSFTIPPQDGSDPNWTINDITAMSHAWVYEPKNNTAIDLKAWAVANPASFHAFAFNDWGSPTGLQYSFNGTHSFAGSATGWGGAWAVDPSTHIAYVATDQASPDGNGTGRQGPDLWSDSVIAINVATGQKVWAFQTTSHDLYDWDCSWGVVLANATVAGVQHEVVIKGCKNGTFYMLDAATGKLYWAFTAPSILYAQYSNPKTYNDPTSQTDMRVHNWPNYPSIQPFIQNPWYLGGIESNPAYDPVTNRAFVVTFNMFTSQCSGNVLPLDSPYPSGGGTCHVTNTLQSPTNGQNSTLWAIDVSTGQAACSYNVGDFGFRGGISVTNGLVIVPRSDGNIDFVKESDCTLVSQKFIDGGLVTNMAIGADVNGRVQLIMPASGAIGSLILGFAGFPTQPGYIFSLALPTNLIQTTHVTTIVTSGGGATGVDPTLFYGVVAVAVIFIIVTGFLAARRGKKSVP